MVQPSLRGTGQRSRHGYTLWMATPKTRYYGRHLDDGVSIHCSLLGWNNSGLREWRWRGWRGREIM